MREILFRGKTEDGKWVEGYFINTEILSPSSFKMVEKYGIITEKDIYQVIPETIGQYTGLIDKNGKKIFEGDIIKHYKYRFKYKIAFNNGTFGTVYNDIGEVCSFSDSEYVDDAKEYEVISNIHDNPELLKEEVNNEQC